MTLIALMSGALTSFITKGKEPWTFKPKKSMDSSYFKKTNKSNDVFKPDGKLTFDLLTNVSLTATNHEKDQPSHLVVKEGYNPIELSYEKFNGPESRFCPAKV